MALADYDRAKAGCESLVAQGIWQLASRRVHWDMRFHCQVCSTAWRLELPDPPAPGGLWFRTAEQQKIGTLSEKHRNGKSIVTPKAWPEPDSGGA